MTSAPTPTWLQTLAEKHLRQNVVQFIIHGHVDDLLPTPAPAPGAAPRYVPVADYLRTVLLQPRQFVVTWRPGVGLVWRSPEMESVFRDSVVQFDATHRSTLAVNLDKATPNKLAAVLEHFFRQQLQAGKGVALVIEETEKLAPAGPGSPAQQALMNSLVTFSHDRLFVQGNFIALLMTQRLDSIHNQLTQNTYATALNVPPPDEAQRLAFIQAATATEPSLGQYLGAPAETLAKMALGLSLKNLGHLLRAAQDTQTPLTEAQLAMAKRHLRAAQPGGLLVHSHPEHLPTWVENLARMHAAKTVNQFILHGNVVDYVPHTRPGGERSFLKLRDYLIDVLFADREIVVTYDRAAGIGFRNNKVEQDFFIKFYFEGVFKRDSAAYEEWLKKLKTTEFAFSVLERYFEARLQQGQRVAFIIEYAETLVPMNSSAQLQPQDRSMLVFLQKWAKTSQFLSTDLTTVLITENVNDIHQSLVRSPFTQEIELMYPDESQRLGFIQHYTAQHPTLPSHLEMSLEVLARDTAGLTLVQLRTLLSEIIENSTVFTFKELTERKKDIIESEAGGMLGFVETKFNLDAVAGHKYAKENLRNAARALKSGRADVLPMGYLVNGPVGTGKTFMVSCFAADIGIPMVELKNFRSQYVGMTEANLEKVLRLLKAMNPVAVLIDEADAALGNRGQGGDSGVSSRVFSTIASFMSNTDHRGKIIWFLLTARPDLMPIDLKRQGRAEEHIALFYPETREEKQELLEVMLRKTKIKSVHAADFSGDFFDNLPIRSGADMEAALTRAKFRAATQNRTEPTPEDIQATFADFIPPTYPEEVELMNLVAVLECTSRELLPETYRNMPREQILSRLEELKRRVPR